MKKHEDEGFSRFLGETKKTKREALLEKCRKHDVSIYVDDATEPSSGVYADLRAVASEAELERRLNSKLAVGIASCANMIAIFALLCSLVALVRSFF
jgi:hypothetical protein